MGLHICYELRLPGVTSDDDALEHLERLRTHALTLGVSRVTEVVRLTGEELALGQERETWSLPWLLRVSAESICGERDGGIGPIDEQNRVSVAGFLMHPGEGSESAVFGLVRPALSHQRPDPTAETVDEQGNWFWHYCCKTQYASAVSDEHLVRCHLAVVELLEEATRLGFGITVRDETHYWETRSTERLIAEVRNMNRIVARIAGALSDRLSPDHRAEGAIFEHPEFEHLESEPVERLDSE